MRVLSVVVVGLAWSMTAAAQVNAENFASRATEPGLGIGLAVGHTSSVGNVDLFDLREEGAIQYLTAFDREDAPNDQLWFRDRIILSARGAHKGANGEPILNETLAHLRYTHNFLPRVGVDLFSQIQNDRVLLLEWRALAGGGLRLTAFLTEHGGLWGGTGYMLEREVRNVPVGGPDEPRVLNHRSTSYLSWRWEIVPDALAWVNTAYVQPRLDDFTDVQFVDESELAIQITDVLGVKSALRVREDSQPPADLERWDIRVTSAVTLSWHSKSKDEGDG